jgi:hypothetical protein
MPFECPSCFLVVVAYGHLGLGTALTLEGPCTRGLTVAAAAVPLRKAASCSRAQYFYTHPRRKLQRGRSVRIDLTIQRHFFELRCCPFHNRYPVKTILNFHIIQFDADVSL